MLICPDHKRPDCSCQWEVAGTYRASPRPSKLYVAASSTQLSRAAEFMRLARIAGWTITLDWVEVVRSNGGVANPSDVDRDVVAGWARADMDAVTAADVVVLLAPSDTSPARGAFVELGVALACDKPVLAVADPGCASIFLALATESVASDAEAHAQLARWARDGLR